MHTQSAARLFVLAALAAGLLAACGDDSSSGTGVLPAGGSGGSLDAAVDAAEEAAAGSDAAAGGSGGAQGDASTDSPDDTAQTEVGADVEAGPSCGRVPGPEDGERVVIVSRPYTGSYGKAEAYEVLKLTATGVLSFTGEKFAMGRSNMGDIVFTPDGKLGLASQDEDGSLGVFEVAANGSVKVVHAKFKGGFYAARLVMHPSGDRVYVVDSQWATISGGIHAVRINCDGTLTDEGRVLEAKLPYVLLPVPGKGQYVTAAKDLLGSAAGDDAHLITLEPQPARLASADPFADDGQIIASGAMTPDGRYALLGDNSEFSGVPNRVAVLEVGDNSLTQRQTLPDVSDPVALLVSPANDAAIVVSGYGNGIKVLGYDANNAAAPFTMAGNMVYAGAKPQLPGRAVMLERGQLKGRVLVAENVGVRMVEFTPGSAKDLGLTASPGSGGESMVGTVGIQP
jgi:6-phosphogluconolactonase (cycloisomerase 2 family)